MNVSWKQPDIRDEAIDYVRTWADKTEFHAKTPVGWIGIPRSKYYQWRDRCGLVNEHNAQAPRDHWLEDWEKQAIVDFHHDNPLEVYRRLIYMMINADIVAVRPSSVYRVLKMAGLLGRWKARPISKGDGFRQAIGPNERWPDRPDENRLTMTRSSETIRFAGETEAGSAGKQPARDSRPSLRQQLEAGLLRTQRWRVPRAAMAACRRSSPMPQNTHPWNTRNRPTVGWISCLLSRTGLAPSSG